MSTIHWFVSEVDPKNAGYRVRTLPLVAELREQGLAVEVHTLSTLPQAVTEIGAKARAVVVSKPGDSLTALCMSQFLALGVPVVVDLFDNYFSWSAAAVQRQIHWQWLRTLKSASLVISSTDFLAHVIGSLTDKPVLQVSDLVPPPPPGRLSIDWLAQKWQQPETIELLWFGISGNPYYLAGLEDLVRWAGLVRELSARLAGLAPVRLTICTNRVPAVNAVLETLRAEQVDIRFVEWTAAVCDALLEQSHVALLPTNLSGFSLAKTHNRCSDALARGCLVLGSPQGPYRGLGGAVFDAPQALVDGLLEATPQSVLTLLQASYKALRARHDMPAEVRQLAAALHTVAAAAATRPARSDPKLAPAVLVATALPHAMRSHAREAGHLLALCLDGPKAEGADFRIDSACTDTDPFSLALSDLALATLDRLLANDVEADLTDRDGHTDVTLGSWRLRLQRGPHRLLVLRGLPAEVLQQVAEAQAGVRQGNELFEARVGAMTRVLRRLGLHQLHFAGDEVGGWQAYAEQADPELAAMEQRLRAQWVRFEGREVDWGRPVKELP